MPLPKLPDSLLRALYAEHEAHPHQTTFVQQQALAHQVSPNTIYYGWRRMGLRTVKATKRIRDKEQWPLIRKMLEDGVSITDIHLVTKVEKTTIAKLKRDIHAKRG